MEQKVSSVFMDQISLYLNNRASKDEQFAERLNNPNKSIEECCKYIIGEVYSQGVCGLADDEVYGMAVHYFDEDNVTVSDLKQCKVVVNHHVDLSPEEIAEAKQKAMDKVMAEQVANLKKKTTQTVSFTPKEKQQSDELSLF